MGIKIQLILLVEEETNPALIKDQDLSGYTRVDLLYWGSFGEMMKNYKDLAGEKFLLHNVAMDVDHHVNQFVSPEYDYYVVSETLTDLDKIPSAIADYNSGGGFLLLIKSPSMMEYNGLVCKTGLHRLLGGSVLSKIDLLSHETIKKEVYNCLADFYCESTIREIGKNGLSSAAGG